MNNEHIFYQIDYIDEDGLANYIDTFKSNELVKAKRHLDILNKVNKCLNDNTMFVLDMYKYNRDTDEDDLIMHNITKAETIKRYLWRIKNECNNK